MAINKRGFIAASKLALGVLIATSCGSGEPAIPDDPGLKEDIGVGQSPFTKGDPRAALGDGDYCDDPSHPCAAGEGDCDNTTQCESGLVCGSRKGLQFGSKGDACVPPHCVNKVMDADETQVDCGGSCGATCAPPVPPPPPTCTVPTGAGDKCTPNCTCPAGLVCGSTRGAQFGFTGDACVAAHCANHVRDADETGVDCGGECGSIGCSTRGCLHNATYEITVTEKISEKFNASEQYPGCSVGHSDVYDNQIVLEATVSNGAVTITGAGFAGTYTVVQDTNTSFTATNGSTCGTIAENSAPTQFGQGSLTVYCQTGVAKLTGSCLADFPDTCYPNYQEAAQGTGTATVSGG